MMPPKFIVAGAVPIIGVVGCPIMKVTGSVCVPAGVLKIIEPVYVPEERPETLTLTNEYVDVIPLIGLRLSHWPPLFVVTDALHCNGLEHPCVTPVLMTLGSGDGC